MTEFTPGATVGICDTQPIMAAGVRAVIASQADLEFAWTASSLDEAVRMVRLHPPCVLLVDKALGMNGLLHWILSLTASSAATAFVVWGASLTEAEALRLVQAGAKGVMRKAVKPEALAACLRAAGRGSVWLEDVIFRAGPRGVERSRSDVTPREEQVLSLVEQGLTNGEIARELGIRPGTVKIHLKHIYGKTGMRGRYHLALSALENRGALSMTV